MHITYNSVVTISFEYLFKCNIYDVLLYLIDIKWANKYEPQ